MSEWREVTLSELGKFSSGKPITPGQPGEFKAYGANGVIGGSDEARYGSGIIVGRVGAYCGAVAVSHEPFWASDNTIVIEPAIDEDLDYLGCLLRSAQLHRHAGGAAQPLVTQGILKALRFRVPGPDVRVCIGQVMAVFDDLIENNRRRIELLEEMARAIYREWFVKFRYPGHEDVPMVDSVLGPIPEGWEVVPASTLITVNPRIKLDKSVKHPFITMGDLDEGSLSCRPSDVRAGGSGTKFELGDTLFARITPCLQNGKTGLVQSLAVGEVGMGSTEFIVLRGRLVGSAYTYCLARDEHFRGHAISSMSGASGRQRVRNECFDSYLIAAPPGGLSDEFEDTAEPLLLQAKVLFDESGRLGALRDALLPKLVTGQIDVSTLDLDALFAEQVA
ncbi:restriction endonuclease subunit S [Brevibacterium litoralis]|uniref:restriction endonuclease subunit S n=1 Tax=Brevibacterium litoralis TaxID=3138935 RepID=UPI0032EE1724